MSFFKSKRILKKVLFAFAAFSFFFYFNSCEQLIDSVDTPVIPGASVGGGRTLLAPSEILVTQGAKQKITISWEVVPNAIYYQIYYAYNANDEFIKLDETDKNFYEDKVPAGSTVYYKIKSEKANGELSDFSKTIKGTSLAVPTICDGDFGETESTIYWYMQNSRDERTGEDNYEANLQYIVTCEVEGTGEIVEEKQLAGYQNNYTFKGLASNTSYLYSVSAFLLSDQTATENSPKVNALTLYAYTPQSPEFTASEGTFLDNIKLAITLPPMVQVNTETTESPNEKVIVNYPLYFKIERKSHDAQESDYVEIVSALYYTGSTVPINDYSAIPYSRGSVITWTDTDTNLASGVKYDYRIKSYTDTNYSDQIGSKYKEVKGAKNGNVACGWKCSRPVFECTHPNIYSPNGFYVASGSGENEKIIKITLGFSLSWNDLGKAGNYKYAIKQSRREINDIDKIINDSWLKAGDSTLFDSVDSINKLQITFDNINTQEGLYIYTLYIIPANYNNASEGETSALVNVAAESEAVSSSTKRAKAEITKIVSGYKDKVIIEYTVETGVHYSVKREIDGDSNSAKEFDETEVGASGTFEDKTVESGKKYKYTLYSRLYIIKEHTNGHYAETLGTPAPLFESKNIKYDSIMVTMPEVLAATSYEGTFGSTPFSFDSNGNGASGISVEKSGTNFKITLDKPAGWNDATKAGEDVEFTVIAKSSVDTNEGKETTRVLGPAKIELQAEEPTDTSINVSWKEIEGAAGYILRRTNVKEGTKNTYYIGSDKSVKDENVSPIPNGCVKVELKNSKFTLEDIHKEKEIGDDFGWYKNQEKIAWGLEYKYEICPVLSEDFSALDKYSNNKSISASATGYGLNLVVSKAESSTDITLTWEAPYNSSGRTPAVFMRSASANTGTSWAFVNATISGTTATIKPKGTENGIDNFYKPHDYVVKYNGTGTIELPKSFETDLYTRKTALEEPNCRGYVFTLEDYRKDLLKAGHSKDYTEFFEWNTPDMIYGPNKKVKPDSVEIQILNKNLVSGWTTILTLDPATFKVKTGTSAASGTGINYASDSDTSKVYRALLTPSDITSNKSYATQGQLKVLRDYKHYYRILAKRTVNGKSMEATIGDDCSAYGYRDITDEELVKAAMLAFSYGFYKAGGGKDDYSNIKNALQIDDNASANDGKGGSMKFEGRASLGSSWDRESGKYKQNYSATNYAPCMLTPYDYYNNNKNNSLASGFVKITVPKNSLKSLGATDKYPYKLRDNFDITVSNATSDTLNVSATITVASRDDEVKEKANVTSDNLFLKITRGTNTKYTIFGTDNPTENSRYNDNNKWHARRRWLPIGLDKEPYWFCDSLNDVDTDFEGQNTTNKCDYGWWEK